MKTIDECLTEMGHQQGLLGAKWNATEIAENGVAIYQLGGGSDFIPLTVAGSFWGHTKTPLIMHLMKNLLEVVGEGKKTMIRLQLGFLLFLHTHNRIGGGKYIEHAYEVDAVIAARKPAPAPVVKKSGGTTAHMIELMRDKLSLRGAEISILADRVDALEKGLRDMKQK